MSSINTGKFLKNAGLAALGAVTLAQLTGCGRGEKALDLKGAIGISHSAGKVADLYNSTPASLQGRVDHTFLERGTIRFETDRVTITPILGTPRGVPNSQDQGAELSRYYEIREKGSENGLIVMIQEPQSATAGGAYNANDLDKAAGLAAFTTTTNKMRHTLEVDRS